MTTAHRFTLRIPDPLYQQAQAEAQRLGISLNALLLVALDTYLQSRGQPNPQPTASPSPADNPPATKRQKKRKRKKR